jgi:DNA-binding response OmpR family regulator
MAEKILIVDDQPELTWLLQNALEGESYEIEVAHDGPEGLRKAYHFQPDLVLLDILMPEMSGREMLRRLREFSDVPVIMLTALSGTENKVLGLDLGADDYITKPFEIKELQARIRAALRRAVLPPADRNRFLSFDGGRLVIDPASHQVTARGEPVDLTPTEFKLLFYLAYHAGQVLTCDQILDGVWGPGYQDSSTNVKVYVRRLRRKIEANPSQPRYILTQWGVGYCMTRT